MIPSTLFCSLAGHRRLGDGIGLLLIFFASSCGLNAAENNIEFNRDIRPILSDACFHCHGPDQHKREAGVRLDVRDDALKTAESGAFPIVPGHADKSEIIRRILTDDLDEQMPPPKAHKTLTPAQKETLRQWIDQGAEYQMHWAYLPIQKPQVPTTSQHPVDAFIRQRLALEKMPFAEEADRVTLIRRVTLDLTGLPATPKEVDAFLADTAEGAYERVVDRLFASPHYAERMALDWMDAARYADTNGYQVDRDRTLHAWRDWVIQAFQENKRFDQFTIEQLAGDLLPNATLQQQIATGFIATT